MPACVKGAWAALSPTPISAASEITPENHYCTFSEKDNLLGTMGVALSLTKMSKSIPHSAHCLPTGESELASPLSPGLHCEEGAGISAMVVQTLLDSGITWGGTSRFPPCEMQAAWNPNKLRETQTALFQRLATTPLQTF